MEMGQGYMYSIECATGSVRMLELTELYTANGWFLSTIKPEVVKNMKCAPV